MSSPETPQCPEEIPGALVVSDESEMGSEHKEEGIDDKNEGYRSVPGSDRDSRGEAARRRLKQVQRRIHERRKAGPENWEVLRRRALAKQQDEQSEYDAYVRAVKRGNRFPHQEWITNRASVEQSVDDITDETGEHKGPTELPEGMFISLETEPNGHPSSDAENGQGDSRMVTEQPERQPAVRRQRRK